MSLNTILATAPLTTTNYILKATGTTIGNSLIWDNGTNVGIGNTNTSYTLDVSGTLRNTTSAYFATTSGSVGIGTASPSDKFSVDAGTGNIVTSSFFNSTMTAGQSTFLEFGKNYSNNYNTGELAFKFVGDGSSSNMVSIGFYGAGNKLNVLGNGNVGIGTSSPKGRFDVFRAAGDSGTAAIVISSGESPSRNWSLNTDVVTDGDFAICVSTTTGGTPSPTAGNTKFYLTKGGNVGIGTSSPDTKLQVLGQVGIGTPDGTYTQGTLRVGYSTGGYSGQLYLNADNNSGGAYIAWNAGIKTSVATSTYAYNGYATKIDGQTGTIRTYTAGSGTAGNDISWTNGPYVANGGVSWTNGSSDIRKKKNFEPSQGLKELLQIEAIKYHFNWEEDNNPKRLGFKAQNLQTLIPEMVTSTGEIAEDGSDYLTITPDFILPVLVKAIQEQQIQIQNLQEQINILAK